MQPMPLIARVMLADALRELADKGKPQSRASERLREQADGLESQNAIRATESNAKTPEAR